MDDHTNSSDSGREFIPAIPGSSITFVVGRGVKRGARGRPYERKPGDPPFRPLRIYTVDSGTRHSEGAVAVVDVPYEPLEHRPDGLKGHVFHVEAVFRNPAQSDASDTDNVPLNDPGVMLMDGCPVSPVAPRFHQQMVYAVASLVYASFRRALGRHMSWGFDHADEEDQRSRLRLKPHGRPESAGAHYNRESGEVSFGFFTTENGISGRGTPGGQTFSCVSHDIVTHEVTHALLDGLRAYFLEPTGGDVLGFHEGFSDVIALLHRFSYPEVVRSAVRRSHGRVLESKLITSIAAEFGRASGNGGAIRGLSETLANVVEAITATTPTGSANRGVADPGYSVAAQGELTLLTYEEDMKPHKMGEVFVSAVFYAFATVYARKIARYMRLATGGTGELPRGDIPKDLQDILVEEASQLASQFLDVCIRAIDYCPPVGLELGDFLRAVITADMDLVPDDRWEYREAWIDAFSAHKIFPRGVPCMSEDALRWEMLPPGALVVEKLSFTNLEFGGDPACPAGEKELDQRARELGEFIAKSPAAFGMFTQGHPDLGGDEVSVPEVHSVRTSRRVGPDGQVMFDLVAEVTQTRRVMTAAVASDYPFLFRGGCTVILGPKGDVRYIIGKSVGQNDRAFRQRVFMQGFGASHVSMEKNFHVPDADKVHFDHLHDEAEET